MCGIVGLINGENAAHSLTPEAPRYLMRGLRNGIYRGPDSTGIIQVNRLFEPLIHKSTLDGFTFSQMKKTQDVIDASASNLATIIHHRAATKGSVKYCNAHPFEWDLDDERWLIGVHNGGVDYRKKEDNIDFEVDSDHLYYRMTRDGAEKALGETRGAYALVWADMPKGEICISGNDERAIHFAPIKGKNALLIASEAAFLYHLASSTGLLLEDMWRPEPGRIYHFDPKGKIRDYYVTKIDEPKVIVAVPERGANSASSKSLARFNPSTRAHELETASFKFEDYYGPHHMDGLHVSHGVDTFFDFKTTAVNPEDNTRVDVYGEVMDETGEIMKAVMLKMPRVVGDNLRHSSEAYAKVIGKRDIMNKKTGTFNTILILSSPTAIKHEDNKDVDVIIAGLGDAVVEDEDSIGATVRGPENKQVTIKKYDTFTKNGCSRCGDSIQPKDADFIGWVNGDQPVCQTCVPLMEQAGYEVV